MKKSALATLLAMTLSVGAAYAAAPTTPTTPGTPPAAAKPAGGDIEAKNSSALVLPTADEQKLKNWIMEQKTASTAAPAGFKVMVGEALPASIMVHPIPASVGVTTGGNQYAVVGSQIVLVNSTDRKIVFVFA